MKGAEATILFEKNTVIKVRSSKSYRHPTLDKQLTKRRTRAEAKMLTRLESLSILAPKLLSVDEDIGKIVMSKIDAPMIRDVVTKNSIKTIGENIGKQLCVLHRHDIIHGDLTTSNMLYQDNNLYFIDFGLSYMSKKDEDRAVDLHLLKQAIDSTHYTCAKDFFAYILKAYTQSDKEKEVIKRFAQVEARGRNKVQT